MDKEEIKNLLGKKYDFTPPDWWECQWRRDACNRPECPLCGRIMKQRFKHKFKGEYPDSPEAFIDSIRDSFEEAMLMIQQWAEEEGIDLDNIDESDIQEPPDYHEHPLFRKASDWNQKLRSFFEYDGLYLMNSEECFDLTWYSNLIPVKILRNLNNRWYIKNEDPDNELDYDYQKYILENCIQIIKKSLENLISRHLPQKNELITLYNEFLSFYKDILSI